MSRRSGNHLTAVAVVTIMVLSIITGIVDFPMIAGSIRADEFCALCCANGLAALLLVLALGEGSQRRCVHSYPVNEMFAVDLVN